jgi:hypothetical protein
MKNNNNIVGEGDVDFDFVQQRADADADAGADDDDDADVDVDVDAENRRLLRLISMLQSRDEFHIRNRNKINELVENFLDQAEEDLHTFLCDNKQHENYRGLDCDRDTEDEVEAAIRFFPNVISRRGGEFHEYPIQLLAYAFKTVRRLTNIKAVSFIPLLVKLAIELGQFDEEEERGGILVEDDD